ncbi:uncharacterized protein LODBEIA_P15950 [Lodderomyces beijingensis]|uniref:pyridoxal 5'-phosphate synthase n=1 Tax=Lodderomyces beijingensis TaxID=1775926 RepID=A0ABP0ZJQ7_9ASCO
MMVMTLQTICKRSARSLFIQARARVQFRPLTMTVSSSTSSTTSKSTPVPPDVATKPTPTAATSITPETDGGEDPETTTQQPIIFAPETYQYTKGHLDIDDVARDPLEQFNRWFKDAQEQLPKGSDIIVEATTFSTARLPSGRVSSRIVLLKELDKYGFLVYSNWGTSKKSQDLNTNKYASLTFFWPHIQRQVRVEGVMEHVTRETSERYYNTRPRGSKIGAWASPQSSTIAARSDLDKLNNDFDEKFRDLKDDEIPCPEYWGGIRIEPLEIEFWQGGLSRLHDRISFRRDKIHDKNWEIFRLAP